MHAYSEKSASRYILVTLAVVLFVTAMVLVILQNTSFKTTGFGIKTYGDGYVDGFTKARELASQAGLPSLPTRQALSGTITDVATDSVTFTAMGLVMDERVDGVGLTRAAYVTKDTVIVLMSLRPAEEMQKLQQAFAEQMGKLKPGGSPPTPPSPFVAKEIALTDVQTGDLVTAFSTNQEDVARAESFYASRLEIRRTRR
ncbi:hypothetical protein A3E39_03000 [Candidatus Uhrbacteria bacterium RIFCSPHIGHO2_12_FULL_60_25]|uniref:Uncharacterized protein n=1 Tax=Candidatus Uhrbacteria bacterium RIFCSPHIGHO2_12_FULL_60_25 TaxID=1802399 RepID=A0A1F7UKH4_9BACT|nr:MAG: hypothetical protein A3D73_00350 [Candidatus Uhrbacteria bacterium RIFCSPHIGHO2_02_FULL_60_44]OGL78198.1 MAG: hypothetical protein A3E39_03000 [Candidatus Uhrbacteria bacterium RIFCSPHIGHO2_12_FULL_60_25]